MSVDGIGRRSNLAKVPCKWRYLRKCFPVNVFQRDISYQMSASVHFCFLNNHNMVPLLWMAFPATGYNSPSLLNLIYGDPNYIYKMYNFAVSAARFTNCPTSHICRSPFRHGLCSFTSTAHGGMATNWVGTKQRDFVSHRTSWMIQSLDLFLSEDVDHIISEYLPFDH